MSRIFISYKRVDKDKVFKIKDQIESALGEKCWIDLDGIESDAQFKNVIIGAINECEIVLFMYSKAHSKIMDFERDWTVRELNFAAKKNKRIVFVNLDGSPLTDVFEFDYGTKQQVDGTKKLAVEKLISDLKCWLCVDSPYVTTSQPIFETRSFRAIFQSKAGVIALTLVSLVCLAFFLLGNIGQGSVMSEQEAEGVVLSELVDSISLNTQSVEESPEPEKIVESVLIEQSIVAPQPAVEPTEAAGYDVVFTCNVTNATLYIDDKAAGRASDTHFLKTGNHRIKVTAEGYKDYSGKIIVSKSTSQPYKIHMIEDPKTVISEPTAPIDETSDHLVSTTTGIHNGHEWIDLGLPSGTKWATMNVGATSPSDYGWYFAWGETCPKDEYTLSNSKYWSSGDNYDNVKFSKYVTDSQYGTFDGKMNLDLIDDAAYVNWGCNWRTPSQKQLIELHKECVWSWTGDGYRVTSKKNGNSIFMPAAGYRIEKSLMEVGESGCYWTSHIIKSRGYAWCYVLLSNKTSNLFMGRSYGLSVRPVLTL